MQDFYAQLVQSSVEKREALRLAMTRVRVAQAATSRWAPFVLFGDWR